MKKNDLYTYMIIPSLVILFMLAGSMSVPLAGQETKDPEHEQIVEEVNVTNIEVPVRVLYKGEPVTDLTVDDFTLYEGKKKIAINGFFLKRKSLSAAQPGDPEGKAGTGIPRTFVLVFNVTDYNREVEKAVNHMFDKLLRPTDRLMVFVNDKTLNYDNLAEGEKIKARLINDLAEESKKAKRRLLKYIKRIENYIDIYDFRRSFFRRDVDQDLRAVQFLRKLLMTWDEYQRNYLVPRVDRFYYFSRYLEKLKGEKWVLNFYQFEFFPEIRPGSSTMDKLQELVTSLVNSGVPSAVARGRLISTLLNKLSNSMSVGKYFPNQEISKLFYKVDATFHGFFIKTSNVNLLKDISYKTVSSDLEKVLKGISDITGGQNITSNDLLKSLETIAQKEDAYYMLTYAPQDPKKAGKLKIAITGKKYKVLYDDNIRADYINAYFNRLAKTLEGPDIKITDFSFKGKILAFTISNFLMRKLEGKNIGQLQIRIRVTDKYNKPLYDKSQMLTAQKKETKLSIPTFKTIIKGEYNFIVDAKDMMTGKEDTFHKGISVKR
ncbi:MAG: hypothetical protein GY940_32215 [bacterium]|nr:hypothetical protein [bacterium]